MKKVLNVGGNSKAIPLPPEYAGWDHLLLDIDPKGNPDIVCDARKLETLDRGMVDAIYCSHNLEHYHRHDVPKVVKGFLHVLKEDGFIHVRVPDVGEVMRHVVEKGMDVEDVLYQSALGPITVLDVIYGYGKEIESSGQDFFAHKNGFTQKSLLSLLARCGFNYFYSRTGNFEVMAYAFKNKPNEYATQLLNLPPLAEG